MYPGMPPIPSMPQLQQPLLNVLTSMALAGVAIVLLSRFLLKTPFFNRLVSQTASGARTTERVLVDQTNRLGQVGTSVSPLRPGGKAQFGADILDVLSEGEMIPKGHSVKIVGFSGREPIVSAVEA
jgi:membrane-bound serine protease (ClpP class)